MNISLDACCDHTQVVADDEFHARMADLLGRAVALMFGRNTYELLYGYWPNVASTGNGTLAEIRLAHTLSIDAPRRLAREKSTPGEDHPVQVRTVEHDEHLRVLLPPDVPWPRSIFQ